jgi:hypothetical protein
MATIGSGEPEIIKSRVVLRIETGFREIASIVKRVETSRLPLVMKRLDVVVDPPLTDSLKVEIEMDLFSL